jgi:hypothetical protein
MSGFDLNDQVHQIQSRADFARFVQALLQDWQCRPEAWGNRDLGSYLEAMAAWATDMEGYYGNRGEVLPEQPTWKMMGQILLAAQVYE